MKQLGEFVVDGKVVEVPGDEREEFEQLAKEHAATPDELHSLRVTEADGRSVDVKVPESQREEFERMAEEKGATFEPLRTLELDDGTKKSMTGGELSRHLRIEKYRANLATAQAEQGSATWAAIKGAIGGFFTGAWAGGNATANKIAKAIPEIGIELESAAGNLARFAGKGLKAIGAKGVGAAVEGAGESVVESAEGAKAWLDEKLPSDVKDWLGYEDWSTKVVDWTNNAAAMAVKFAPGMAKMGAEAFMETIFASDGVNAAARAYDTAIANGQSPEEAAALGGEAFLLNYFGGKALTKAGAWAEGIHGPVKQFMASGMASSGTMATQAAGNKMIDNLAEGKPVLEGVAKESGKGFVEGWAFHGYNALPGLITGVAASRAEHRRREEYARGEILRMVETDADAAKLAMWMDGEALDAAIRARKAAKAGLAEQSSAIRTEALRAGLPETMTPAEINKILDAVAKQREALANRVRINMDDQQAEALCETVSKVVETEQSSAVRTVEIDQKELMERTWNRAADKVTDARDMDDPELREKIVKSAAKEVVAEMEKERRAELDEKSRIRGAEVGEQMKILDDRGIATWEDAEAAGLVGKDERGRWSGGARQAVNIAVNGTEALKTAVKDGKIGGDLAEEMITLSHCELGWMPKESREAIIDKVLETADGNAEMAQWMMEIVGRCDRAELADVDARVRKVADEVAQGMAEQRAAKAGMDGASGGPEPLPKDVATVELAPQTTYEGAKYAERLKGTELKSIDGGMLGCERFPEVSVEITQEGIRVEGLTDELMSKPENTADTAALLKRLDDISRRTGLEIDLGDANALTVAQGIIEEVKRGSLKEAQRKMDTRAQLFDLLMKTTLGNGVTYDEASFNAALEKTPNGRRFVDNHGNIYGFKDGEGVLHFNPAVFNYNTPIHEYGHLALESLKGVNPALLKRGMELIKESDYYKEFKERSEKAGDEYSYLKGDEEGICDEALATLIGDRGQRLVEQKGLGAELRAWLKEFWAAIKGAFGIADLTPEQIEKMTLRDFADAMNAELLRGREFGTKKQRPLSEKSIKRYDEADGSGSNGVLRWKNDRGRLFYIPVDMEKTQPGGKVVLATDDANVTDWIQQRLNGVELRMSKSGKIYIKGSNGLEGELAEIFGRYPKAGWNDGIFEELAADLQNEALREMTPDQLVSALVDDRANYDAWLKATADGKTLEALKEEQHYAEEAEREAAEARERFEQSGMGVLDYIRSRAAEEGEAAFDLDWETMRELARDAEEGKFAVGGRVAASNMGIKGAAEAEAMEKAGSDREDIWRKTGWWRGKDGKWRVELPDVRRGKWHGDPEERHFKGGGEDFYRYKLTELIEDGDFLKAYPQARKITVEFHKNMPANIGGNFNEATLTIKLPQKYQILSDYAKAGLGEGKAASLNEAGRKTIVHELQHAIQLFESFAKGGSPTEPVRHYALDGNTGHALSVFSESIGMDPTNRKHLAIIANWAQKITSDYTRDDVPKRLVEKFEAAAKEAGKTPQEFRDEIERFYDSYTETPMGQYFKHEGEVEARNVQARLGMTAEQRAATPPWETEDVAEARQIVKFAAGRAEQSSAVRTVVEANPNLKEDVAAAVNVDRNKGKIVPLRKVVEFSKTPPFLMRLGVPDANIISRADILRKIKGKHLLTEDQIADLPNRYASPVAVMKDGRNYVILTDMDAPTKTSGEKPVMVYLKAVGNGAKHNFIASAYAREANKEQTYVDLVRGGKLIYMDENRIAVSKLEDATLLQFKPQAVRGDFKGIIAQTGAGTQGGAESKTILERLGDKAKGLGVAGLQSPRETEASAFNFGSSERQLLSGAKGTMHSLSDFGSPVKGVGAQTDSHQFKRWFAESKVVDANGEPLVVYRGAEFDPLAQETGKGVIKPEAYFTADPEYAKRYTGNGGKVQAYYLNIRRPFDIRDPECLADLKKVYPDHEFQKGKSGALDWAEASTIDGEFLKENFGDKYDGIIYDEGGDPAEGGPTHRGISYVPLYGGAQVKSATDNIGTFDPGNNDVRFHAGRGLDGSETIIDASRFVARRARVAADAGVGEQTPGAIAASRELATQGTMPISQLGQFRKMSLPLSELLVLQQKLTGSAMPGRILAERSSAIRTGQWGSHTKAGQIAIQADLLGMVDGTDMVKEKETLKQHGFYQNEDSQWLANHSQAEIRAEQRRSEDQLATQLLNLAKRRTQGTARGGGSAARRVFADQVAKYVMDMPQNLGGTLGRVQTVGRGVRNDVRARFGGDATAAKSEAGDFLDWAYGAMPTDAQGNPVRRAEAMSLDDLTSSMFGSWLVMPQEVERRAPKWDEAFTAAIAADARLLEAFKELSVRAFTEQSHTHVELKIEKQLSRQVEEAIKKLEVERTEETSAGSRLADAKETVLVGLHDKFAPVYVRVDEKVKAYRAAKKQLLKRTASAVDRAAIRAEIDRFEGEMAAKMHKLELSRTAFERGANNEGRRYWMEMARLDNDATGRWGLEQKDISLYLELQRVIETQGRSGSFGQSPQQARLSLGDMARRLGAAKWARMEEYSRRFHDIIMREIYDDPRVERALGSGIVNYFRSQSHYVTTKRTFSPEELDAIETARAQARAAGVAGGDDVITEMYKYAGSCGAGDVAGIGAAGWTAALKGSFAAKQEVRSATWMKHDGLMQFARRNQMILDLRDALVTSGVEGVRELPAAKGAEFPDNKRYGHLTFMENGQKRVLVVPKQIAEAFKADPDLARWITKANGWVRKALIDYNVAYWGQNVKRNQDSIEKNMPGTRETYLKTLLRATVPGASPIMDLMLQALVRRVPKTAVMFNDHTVFAHIPKAERYARILEDLSGWQKELWAAEDAHDAAKVTRMYDDYAGVMEMLKGNFLTPTSAAYAGGDTTHGFVFDAMNRKGMKTLAQIEEESQGDKKWSKFVRKVNVFRMNAAQQEHEEILAKTIAYLHDRAHYSMERSVAESGLMVKKNVSIAEGERKGRLARPVQQAMAQFYNMVEKGVTRHWRNFKERPGEMLAKDGKVWIGRAMGMMLANGAARAWMLADSDGDEEKARQKYGLVYDYAAAYHTAWKNCSNYVKENYNFTPIWNSKDGFTSVIFGGALTDEDKLIVPTADFVANMAAHKMGVGPKPEIGKPFLNATVKAVTPDLALASPVMNFLRSAVEAAVWDNPTDYFRGAPMYDQSLWEVRNESWEMRGKFAVAVGAKLWGDLGGRAIWAPDIYGVDNGRGNAPETVEAVLRKIPVVSPAIARMVKIQVGSPAKHGEAITEEAKRRRAIIDVCAKDLMRQVDANGVDIWERDPQGYERQLATWKERYRLNDLDVMRLRVKYLNGAHQRKNRAGFDQKELGKLMKEAARMGMTKEQFWLELGEM